MSDIKSKTFLLTNYEGEILVYNLDYENLASKLVDIAELLTSTQYQGRVIFDNLTSNGFSHNRYINMFFDGQSFLRKEVKLHTPKKALITYSNTFYRSLNLSNSILSERQIDDFVNLKEDFLSLHLKATYGVIMNDAPKELEELFNSVVWTLIAKEHIKTQIDQEIVEIDFEQIKKDAFPLL